MDFDLAAKRLARDQHSRQKARQPVHMSAKAKADARLLQQQQRAAAVQRSMEQRQAKYWHQFFQDCEESIAVKLLGSFRGTSIHGQGDKIALPPSVLEQLTSMGAMLESTASPWTFRVALVNPDYTFPSSPILQSLVVPEEDDLDDASETDSDDETDQGANAAYLDELDHKYLAYTHATVVEFTQEEGNVGLPEPIASVLIETARRKRGNALETFRTNDMAADSEDDQQSSPMDTDEERTPGHLAWGAFDLPSAPVEISLVRLPKGHGATLTPTPEAIQNGFYNLDDIKLVLEQSLVRTRATLTVGDVVHSWHRGKKFNLKVSALRPSRVQAVLCLNTDLEVEFGEPDTKVNDTPMHRSEDALKLAAAADANHKVAAPPLSRWGNVSDLPVEPDADREGICLVQIRADASHARRRFDTSISTVKDLFVFASTLTAEANFQLVTRFPRRILTLDDAAKTLNEAGITSKQELFMVERC